MLCEKGTPLIRATREIIHPLNMRLCGTSNIGFAAAVRACIATPETQTNAYRDSSHFIRSLQTNPRNRAAERTNLFHLRRIPDRPSKLAHVDFAHSFMHLPFASVATPGLGNRLLLPSGGTPLRREPLLANQNASSPDSERALVGPQRRRRP
jgi:hypothetical protein